MLQALLVSSTMDSFLNLVSSFTENDVAVTYAESGSKALSIISERSFDVVIADESFSDMTGLDLAKKLILKNPMLNLAVVSSLSSQDFHEASEGLGILMQLPSTPKKLDAEKLLAHVKNILSLTRKIN
jgi:DNA-binding NtrC family response regulator